MQKVESFTWPLPFPRWGFGLWLANWMVHMQCIGYGCTWVYLCQKVQDKVKSLKLVTPFPSDKPGHSWYYSFMKWHPYLSRQTLLPLGHERACISMPMVIEWCHGLCQYLCEEGLEEILQDPLRIFNADKSHFLLPQSPQKSSGSKKILTFIVQHHQKRIK